MLRQLMVGLLMLGAGAPLASAGLFEELYRGLDILATPSGSPVFGLPQGGRANGQRVGRLRIVPEGTGRGYNVEFDRTFGSDSFGRPEVLDLGPMSIQLVGGIDSTLGYTNRGFLTGTGEFNAQNLTYQLRTKTGAQDVFVQGRLNLQSNVLINQFGFYEYTLNAVNDQASIALDGVVVDDQLDLNMDVGPISVQGNIFADLVLGLLDTFGVDTSGVRNTLFEDSPIDALVQSFESQVQAQVAGIAVGEPSEATALLNQDLVAANSATAVDLPTDSPQQAPEPAALLALVIPGLLVLRRR